MPIPEATLATELRRTGWSLSNKKWEGNYYSYYVAQQGRLGTQLNSRAMMTVYEVVLFMESDVYDVAFELSISLSRDFMQTYPNPNGWVRPVRGGPVGRNPALGADQLLPGCMYLGLGFNLAGSYDISGAQGMGRLFDTGQPGSLKYADWTVPGNVRADAKGEVEVQTRLFEGRADVAEFFAVKAGLEAKYLGFSGAVSAGFENISRKLSEYTYGMSYYYTTGYEVALDEATIEHLVPEMKSDPDYLNLPETYLPQDPQNQAAFFRFFQKYGTAFVSSVRMGGRLYYNAWIDKSHGMSSSQIEASLKLEYAAVFNANASTQWKSIDQRWSNNRRCTIQAWGGDGTKLKGISDPKQGDSFYTQFSEWVDSVATDPGPVGFGLKDIATLFSGARADAVKIAADDFRGRSLQLQSSWGTAAIRLSGAASVVSSSKPTGVGFAVFDRTTLALLASGVQESTADGFGGNPPDPYAGLMSKLNPYIGNSKVIVAMLFWNLADVTSDFLSAPSPQLYDLLHSLGASDGLSQWGQPVASNAPNASFGTGSSGAWGKFTYAIVGVPGSGVGSALEDFDKVTSAHPAVDLEVLLRPGSDGASIRYSPS